MSEDQGYGWLKAGADLYGLEPLPAWKNVPADTQEHVLGVLRRLALSRVMTTQDGLGDIEREVGIGEDRALRIHLLLTCFEMLGAELGDAPAPVVVEAGNAAVGARFHDVFSRLLGEQTREWISKHCWVYREDPLEAWEGLEEVKAGFMSGNDDGLEGLSAARKRWDDLEPGDRLLAVTSVMRAVMLQYNDGTLPSGRRTRSIWGNVALLRKFSEAAQADRINLLSETAFAGLREGDKAKESFQGVTAVLDDDELFVCRADLDAKALGKWTKALAEWKPRRAENGGGETLFAWSWGGALVIPESEAVERLEGWLQEALVRLLADSVAHSQAA